LDDTCDSCHLVLRMMFLFCCSYIWSSNRVGTVWGLSGRSTDHHDRSTDVLYHSHTSPPPPSQSITYYGIRVVGYTVKIYVVCDTIYSESQEKKNRHRDVHEFCFDEILKNVGIEKFRRFVLVVHFKFRMNMDLFIFSRCHQYGDVTLQVLWPDTLKGLFVRSPSPEQKKKLEHKRSTWKLGSQVRLLGGSNISK
jgi:hypothetical protein